MYRPFSCRLRCGARVPFTGNGRLLYCDRIEEQSMLEERDPAGHVASPIPSPQPANSFAFSCFHASQGLSTCFDTSRPCIGMDETFNYNCQVRNDGVTVILA